MLWKRKKKEWSGGEAPLFLKKIAIRLNGGLIQWAAHLQQKAKACSQGKLKLLLGLFCLLFTLCSAAVIIASLREKPLPFRITPIRAMPLAERSVQQPVIAEKEYYRFRRLRLYLDSLATTPSGKLRLDSILQKHPNILDTLTLLESIYQKQQKK